MITYIYIERILWELTGLHAYSVGMREVDGLTGEIKGTRVIDYHWQEHTARECAMRWKKFYNAKLEGYYE